VAAGAEDGGGGGGAVAGLLAGDDGGDGAAGDRLRNRNVMLKKKIEKLLIMDLKCTARS
jgi:hypothetical protein